MNNSQIEKTASAGSSLNKFFSYLAKNPSSIIIPASLFAGGVVLSPHIFPKKPIYVPSNPYTPQSQQKEIIFPLA